MRSRTSPPESRGRARQPGPPPLPFALTVGVTGHRLEAIPAAMRKDVETRIDAALAQIEAEALALYGQAAQLLPPDHADRKAAESRADALRTTR